MLTAQQLAYDCLANLGEYSLTSFVEYTGNAANALFRALVMAQNAALGEMYDLNPSLFKAEQGLVLPAGVAVQIGVTNGSNAVSAISGASGPFAGQSILIGGSDNWNTLDTEGGSNLLGFPYTGPTGTQPATLYGDCLALGSGLSKPLGPVWLSDIRVLIPLAGKPAYLGFDSRQLLMHDWGLFPWGSGRLPRSRLVAVPAGFYADVRTLGDTNNTPQVRLYVCPIPDRPYILRFDAAVKPVPVTQAMLGSDGSDPARTFSFPDQNDERFLLPLVRYHFTKCAFFKNEALKKQLAADYADTVRRLETYKVQPLTGSHIQPGGWR